MSAAEKKYAPYLKNLGGRADLNYLFDEMLGEITIGHMFISGGDVPRPPQVKGGLLGADYKIENGRYRFARIFNGENWNPDLRAPLTQPGVEVKVGEYLLEVNGVDVKPPADVNMFFENTADEQVRIKVGPNADGKDAREVTVVPVGDEEGLRTRAWEEDNRRKVDELSGGKLAYVHVPDTNIGGYLNFNRFYFGQVGKQAAIIDERYNHGGEIADSIIDLLERPLRNCAITREGEKFCSPLAQIYGPKTMIINEMSGSGGDALPWMFKQDKVGPLVGTRTWGGLVGIWGYPVLMDGGRVTAPRGAIYGLHGQWEVENTGISPDIEVENDPASVAEWPRCAARKSRAGHARCAEEKSGRDSGSSAVSELSQVDPKSERRRRGCTRSRELFLAIGERLRVEPRIKLRLVVGLVPRDVLHAGIFRVVHFGADGFHRVGHAL